nr:hypothetical protein [Micromonospora sp. DSM 115978]
GSRALTTTDGARRGLVLVAAACHGLSPAMAFAVHRGRIDVVLALVALPLAMAAAAELLGRVDGARRGLAASARLALALVVVVAGAASLLVVAALALAAAVTTTVPAGRRRARSGLVGVAVLTATIPLWPSWRQLVDEPARLLTGGELSTWPPAVASSSA